MGRFTHPTRLISLILVMVFAITATVPVCAAYDDDYEQGLKDGARDGEKDAKSFKWVAAGLLCGLFGVIYAYSDEPKVPADRLIGKSPEYVKGYSRAYEKAGTKAQASQAWTGWSVWIVVLLISASSD